MIKKILLFSIFVLAFSHSKAQTSVYHPFPDSAIVWREYASSWDIICAGSAACLTDHYFQYFFAEEINIGGVIYRKLLRNSYWHTYLSGTPCTSTCPSTSYYYSNEYVGSLRQDTANRKVYFMSNDEVTETLLYDFNLNIGDTLPETYNNVPGFNYVSEIDSIQIGSNYHKRFWISNPGAGGSNYTSLIEGIGSALGLLEAITPVFEAYTTLTCVTIDAIPVYPDTATVCGVITSVPAMSQKIQFSIAPNPMHDYSTLTLDPTTATTNLKMYDSFGRQVRQQLIEKTSITLCRNGLPNGIYFLQLTNDEGTVTSTKIIVEVKLGMDFCLSN